MSLPRLSALRHLLTCHARTLRASNQRRWAQVHDVRFLATTQHRRAVVEKYRDKLDRKAREEGHGTIDELRAAYADQIRDLKQQDAAEVPNLSPSPPATEDMPDDARIPSSTSTPSSPSPASPSSRPQPSANKAGQPAVKPLSSMLDLDKVRTLPDKELAAVWRLRHASSPLSLCAVIPASTYAAMEEAARRSPHFVLPVPHEGQGAELHYLQWVFDPASRTSTVLFTQLAEYKARGEFAQPHTTVTHHVDLMADRGVVLMQGQVAEDRGVKIEHAQWLAVCLQRFYGAGVEGILGMESSAGTLERAVERRRLLEWFSQGDTRFSVEKLMEEAERMG